MSNWEKIVQQSEEVLAKPDIAGCHKILTEAYAAGEQHPEILWRLGRSYYEMAEESTEKAIREPLLKMGLDLCKKSVEAEDNNFASHKWLGILISSQSVGTKEKIENAYVIRDEFKKAVELNPKDPTSLHCMGNWCYSVLQVGWLERKAAAMIFATPPSSTYEECLQYLEASAKVGNTIHNATLIGDAYYQQKKYDEAKHWYQDAIAMPATTELQKRNRKKAEEKLAKC